MSAIRRSPEPDLETWCDYFRGVADAGATTRCAERLAAAPGALGDLGWLRRVAAVGRADAATEIPAGARRVVRALGSVRRRGTDASAGARWRRLPFRVAFDSLEAPAASGVRDASPRDLGRAAPRQVVFESEELSVEVRVENERRDGALVVGQVTRRDDPASPVADLPILLVAGQRAVASATSSALGEFYAERLPAEPLVLCLVLDDERVLELPLGPRSTAGVGSDAERDTIPQSPPAPPAPVPSADSRRGDRVSHEDPSRETTARDDRPLPTGRERA